MSQEILWGGVALMTVLSAVSIRVAIAEAAGEGLRSVVCHPMVLGMAGLLGVAIANAAEDLLPDLAYLLIQCSSLTLAFIGAFGMHRRRRQARKAQS